MSFISETWKVEAMDAWIIKYAIRLMLKFWELIMSLRLIW